MCLCVYVCRCLLEASGPVLRIYFLNDSYEIQFVSIERSLALCMIKPRKKGGGDNQNKPWEMQPLRKKAILLRMVRRYFLALWEE